MEQTARQTDQELVIEIPSNEDASSSRSAHAISSSENNISLHEDRPSSSLRGSHIEPSPISSAGNSRTSSFGRSSNDHGGRRRSPFNSGSWTSFELFLALSQIVAAVVVLSLSRDEHPHAPLFVWIVGYAAGCVASLPLIYGRYVLHNQASEQDSAQFLQNSASVINGLSFSIPASQAPESDDNRASLPSSRRRIGLNDGIRCNARVKAFFEYLKMALECFFAIWFVLGNVWVFGGHTSSSDAPNLYRLCIVFLAVSCIGYAMPFILCVTICCCLPCIISFMGFREDLNQFRGATNESINALSTYKFKIKKSRGSGSTDGLEAGVVGAGTEKERVIPGEDAVLERLSCKVKLFCNSLVANVESVGSLICGTAVLMICYMLGFLTNAMKWHQIKVCCICLAKYTDNEELRELPCTHLFHKDCVDKWLKINALCPLCKVEVGQNILTSLAEATASLRQAESRLSNSLGRGSSS